MFFDEDRGAELFLCAMGGGYDVLRPWELSGLNTLRTADTPEDRGFLIDWLGRLAADPGWPLNAKEAARLKDAVDASMAAPPAYRRLGHFAPFLRGGERPRADDLAARLAP